MLRRSNATTGARAGVNRQFLVNTVRGVQAHNRREEEEDCWRLHRMQDKRSEAGVSARIGSKSDYAVERARPSSSCDNRSDDQSASDIVNSRKHWAEVKRKAMSQRPSAEENVDSCEPSPIDAKKDTRSNTSPPKGKCLGKRKRRGRERRESDKGFSTDEEPTKKRASSRKGSASEDNDSKKTRKRKKKR